jgi:hypothetical protein
MRPRLCRLLQIARRLSPLLSLTMLLPSVAAHSALAQTYGIATMQPGTLNHTSGSAIGRAFVAQERDTSDEFTPL